MNQKRAHRSRTTALAIIAVALLIPGAAFGARHYLFQSRVTHAPVSTDAVASTTAAAVPDISKTPVARRSERDKLFELLSPGDPASVFKVVDAIQADPKLRTNCHEMAHDLGHQAYELYGFSGALNFTDAVRLDHTSVQDICAGGYVHGVLEEAALHDASFEKDPGKLCRTLSTDQRAGCFHGVGHALMFKNIRYVPIALGECRKAGDVNDASRCFEGVWMELFWGNNDYVGTGDLGWNLQDPLATCRATDDDAKPACFIYGIFGYLREHPKDYAGAVSTCTQAGMEERDTEFCLKGLGITMISRYKNGGLEHTEDLVVGLTMAQKKSFYQGVIGYGLLSAIPRYKLSAACQAMTDDSAICADALAGR